jgi:hypothetical protein
MMRGIVQFLGIQQPGFPASIACVYHTTMDCGARICYIKRPTLGPALFGAGAQCWFANEWLWLRALGAIFRQVALGRSLRGGMAMYHLRGIGGRMGGAAKLDATGRDPKGIDKRL